ncbi:MAG: NAD(P)H-binding protein [Steroidobacteraceae bacterium]
MKRRLLFLLLVGMLLPPIVPAVLDNTQPESSQQAACRGILLFGGTGRLGASIARLLASAGEPVTVFRRSSSPQDRLDGLNVRYVVGDLADERSISAAFDAQPFCAAIDASAQRGASNSVQHFYENAARWIVQNAKRTGVRQFILHGSIGAGDNRDEVPALRDAPASDRLIDKGRAEQAVIAGGVPYTIIRHGLVPYDPQPPATGRAYLTPDLTTWGEITRDDLAILTLDVLGNPARFNRIYHAIDPQLRLRRDAGTDLPRSIGGPSTDERKAGATAVRGARDSDAKSEPAHSDTQTTTDQPDPGQP